MLKAKIFESQIIFKSLGARKPKGLNRISKIGYGHIFLREYYYSQYTKIISSLNPNTATIIV
jgi:hypothetical protein